MTLHGKYVNTTLSEYSRGQRVCFISYSVTEEFRYELLFISPKEISTYKIFHVKNTCLTYEEFKKLIYTNKCINRKEIEDLIREYESKKDYY